jgi:hypothetical protein
MTKLYLAGPMTGYPQFNFPLFFKAAEIARSWGFDIISPAELDAENNEDYEIASNSPDGALGSTTQTYGDYLGRDVKIIADEGVEGILFLPRWEESKGARLEAYVSLQQGHTKFFHYIDREGARGQVKEYDFERVVAGVSKHLVDGAAIYNKQHGL